ncbi:MAG TPA: TlpA disulfide reductase family protein [Candidatus Acidoferrales bacterium]|jgi:peroxiredoxin|nr:TlpA disulfide reductase family protein [Candidatus Acidoferrales bacterium]
MTKILAGHVAPAFTLPTTRSETISLADALKKGPVVAAFFKITCPVCQFTFPFLERLYKAQSGDAVSFFGISQNDAAETNEFLTEYGVTFPTAMDEDGYPVSNQYGLTTVPTVLLIQPDGKVGVSSVGFSKKDIEQIAAELGKHFQKPPAKVFLPSEVVPDYKPG